MSTGGASAQDITKKRKRKRTKLKGSLESLDEGLPAEGTIAQPFLF
jgi:hypothetical protein